MNERRVVAAAAILMSLVPSCPAGTNESEIPGGESAAGAFEKFWEDQRASGTWRSDYFQSSKSLDDSTGFVGATVQLKLLPSISEQIDAKLEVRATDAAIGRGAHTHARLLECYGTYHFGKADLRVGKQIVAWGRADGINPTDNLTPRDYTVMLPFEDDQRFGTPAAKLDAFLSKDYTLILYATPFFEPTLVPLPAAGTVVIETRPVRSLADTAVGVKLDKVAEGLDWSVSYYNGFSLLPDFRRIDTGASSSGQALHYDRIRSFGADMVRNFGRFGFRGELAYIDTADHTGADPAVKNPFLYWIAGVDRTFFTNLNLNLQFFQRRVRHFHDPDSFTDPRQRAVAAQNAAIDGQLRSVNDGISFRINNKWLNDTLEAEIFAVVNFGPGNRFVRPLMTYAFNDRWKGTAGAELYSGAPGTQYGSLKRNRGGFLELRYGF